MKHSTSNLIVRPQWLEGPLAAWLAPFADWLSALGYAWCTIRRKVLLVSRFSQWLEQETIAPADINPDRWDQFLQYRWQRLRPHAGDRYTLGQFTDFLQRKSDLSFGEKPEAPMTDVELCAQSYEHYLRQVRGLAPTTTARYLPIVRSFLRRRFALGTVTLSRLRASDIVEFVQHMASGLHPKGAKMVSGALRSFLRYTCHLGETGPELVAAVPAVASWSMLNIPKGIAADQVDKLLDSINRNSATGKRDYAIVLLLARLGLRANEIRLLELDHIDWINGTLRIRTKGAKCRTFPLSREVGEAIADYLRHGRPACANRCVFLRARAPIAGFLGSYGICSIVRHAIKRSGVVAPTFGTHQFRHGLATEMLHGGSSLEEIGDVLGHVSPDTTRIYAKVDLDALRSLALPWPGGVQ